MRKPIVKVFIFISFLMLGGETLAQKWKYGIGGGMTFSGFYSETLTHLSRGHIGVKMSKEINSDLRVATKLNYQGSGSRLFISRLDSGAIQGGSWSGGIGNPSSDNIKTQSAMYLGYLSFGLNAEYKLGFKEFYSLGGVYVSKLLHSEYTYYRTVKYFDNASNQTVEYNLEVLEQDFNDQMNGWDAGLIVGLGYEVNKYFEVEYALNLGLMDLKIDKMNAILQPNFSNHYHNVTVNLFFDM